MVTRGTVRFEWSHERDNHETDEKHGLDQRDADLPKRVAHVLGHVVADHDLYAVRQACVDVLEEHAELVDLDLVRAGQRRTEMNTVGSCEARAAE